jgi:glycolate oxidase iron-sulfur subunit
VLHRIDTSKLGAHGEDMAKAVSTCVHCGFCLPACPTYRVLGEEMDSPRGRILLMKNVLEGELAADEALPYVDRCLGCLACVTACPSGVAYGDLLTPFRMHVEKTRERSFLDRLRRRMVLSTLPYPTRFRLAALSGRLGRHFGALVPEQFRAMLDLIPADIPPARPLPALFPATGTRRARVALLAGCAQQVLAPEIGWAALRVLSRSGVEVVVPQDQACCGALAMHVGEEDQARALARTNIRVFPADVDAIVTTAAGCGSGMKEYGLLFRGAAPAEAAAAEHLSSRVVDICEFLDRHGMPDPGPVAWPGPAARHSAGNARNHTANATIPSAAAPSTIRVAYQDACHLAHAQGVRRAPRALLERIPNVTLVEIADGGYCCGSAGTYNLDQPETAHSLGERKADAILATGAQAVVSGNIGCLTQMRTHLALKAREGAATTGATATGAGTSSIAVMHTVELLDRAFSTTP